MMSCSYCLGEQDLMDEWHSFYVVFMFGYAFNAVWFYDDGILVYNYLVGHGRAQVWRSLFGVLFYIFIIVYFV
ncbi:hypothetical protein V8F06_003477 [Rhypophila decipiens]